MSVAGVIYAGVTVSCLPTCRSVPAIWAARPTRRVVDARLRWLQVIDEDF